jgi:transcriptional regulator with GAF, ATPase, and Fis domain
VTLNIGGLSDGVFESELFGHVRGAFTDAKTDRIGRFELAEGGTLFLDEIANVPLSHQARLLRVLEAGEFERVGSSKTQRMDVRLIAATNADLRAEVKAGRFRQDLLFRLNTIELHLPPLRERPEDIPLLAEHFRQSFGRRHGVETVAFPPATLDALRKYSWPGNIRELRNLVERAMITCTGNQLTIVLPKRPAVAIRCSVKLIDVEREHILGVLESTKWRIRGTAGAAEQLGLKPTTLETRMTKLGLSRPRTP